MKENPEADLGKDFRHLAAASLMWRRRRRRESMRAIIAKPAIFMFT
jgi:hypothetical protein